MEIKKERTENGRKNPTEEETAERRAN